MGKKAFAGATMSLWGGKTTKYMVKYLVGTRWRGFGAGLACRLHHGQVVHVGYARNVGREPGCVVVESIWRLTCGQIRLF